MVSTPTETYSWGPSPTLGELGHGHLMQTAKRPEIIKKLKVCRSVWILWSAFRLYLEFLPSEYRDSWIDMRTGPHVVHC